MRKILGIINAFVLLVVSVMIWIVGRIYLFFQSGSKVPILKYLTYLPTEFLFWVHLLLLGLFKFLYRSIKKNY